MSTATRIKRSIRSVSAMGRVDPVVRRVWSQGLTYLSHGALQDLLGEARRVEAEQVPGSLLEAGCAKGGSAIVMAAGKAPQRPLNIYDVFGMIPAPGELDGEDCHERYQVIASHQARGVADQLYYGYVDDLQAAVRSSFEANGLPVDTNAITLVPGLFQETITDLGPVALAHIDGDWYESVVTCLERIVPVLAVGGTIVVDDYYSWSGCRSAVDTFFDRLPESDNFAWHHRNRLHLYRIR